MSRTKIVFFSFFTLITVFTAMLSIFLIDNAQKLLPPATQLNYNFQSDAPPLTIDQMLKLIDEASLNEVSFCAQMKPAHIKEEAVVPVLINEDYFSFYKNRLIGNGITQDIVAKKSKNAVISSTLARKLFFRSDAVGNTITINNEKYTVCGVYQQSDSLINQISNDNLERIYLPYTSINNFSDYAVDMISYRNATYSAALVEQMDLQAYVSINFSEKSKVITDFFHVLLLMLFAGLCIIMLTVWYRGCSKIILKLKEGLENQYLLQLFRKKPYLPVALFILGLGIPLFLAIIFLSGDFSVYIIPKYIPYDNIFDFSYYLNTFIKNTQISNAVSLSGDTYLINLYSNTFHILLTITLLFLIELATFLTVIARKINRLSFLRL